MYKISVIIPVYNMEKYIDECIKSLINQSIGFNNIQVILVDDNSTDDSKKIIISYEKRFKNITAIYLKHNSGTPSIPKNIGVEKALGEYIIFLDPDDYIPKDGYKTLYDLITKTESDFVMGNIGRFNGEKEWIQPQMKISMLQRAHYNIDINEKPEFMSILGYMVTKLINRKFYISNNLSFNEKITLGEDFILSNEMYMKAKKFSYIPEVIYKYRVREDGNDSLTQMNVELAIKNFVEMDNILYKNIKDYNLYSYSNLNSVKSIIYRFDKEFLGFNERKKIKLLKKAKEVFIRFNEELEDKLSNHELGIINVSKNCDIDYLLRFVELKSERQSNFQEYQILNEKLQYNFKVRTSNEWKLMKPLRIFKYKILR